MRLFYHIKMKALLWTMAIWFAAVSWTYGADCTQPLLSGVSKDVTKVISYSFKIGDREVGQIVDRISLVNATKQETEHYTITSRLQLDFNKINVPKVITADGVTSLTQEGAFLSYDLKMKVNDQEIELQCQREGKSIQETMKVSGNTYRKKLVADRLPFYVVDNNMIGLWCLMASQVSAAVQSELSVNLYFPQAMKFMVLDMKKLKRESIAVGDGVCEANVYMAEPIKEMLWIADSGILAKIEAPMQRLTIGPVYIYTESN